MEWVSVLYHRWDTPDNEGNEVIGVYWDKQKAREEMRSHAEAIRAEFPPDIWQEDYTWEEDDEIHLGFDPQKQYVAATIYCWEIVEMEVQ